MFFSENKIISYQKKPLRVQSHILNRQKKRTSQSASKEKKDLFRAKKNMISEDGSVTLEAAVIVPFLLCCFVGMILWGKVFLIHQEIETALLETARQLARQEAVLTCQDQEGTALLGAGILFSQNRKQGDQISGLKVSSVNLLQSEYRKNTKEIYLKAGYVINIPIMLLGTWKLSLKTSVVQKAWNGYAPLNAAGGQIGEYVYITEHGTAYHRDSQCYHLHVTIEEVTDTDRYYEGKTAYRPCEFCVSGNQDKKTLFICEDGECYHEDLACGGLSRTVRYVEISQIGGRQPCADCGD